MMEYTVIIVREELAEFEAAVARHVNEEGWKPQGGVCVCNDMGVPIYYQAMTRDETGRRHAHMNRPTRYSDPGGD